MRCFSSWISSLAKVTAGEVVAIDGKTLRHSFDTASNKAAIHMVSAWAARQRLVLGQIKTEEKWQRDHRDSEVARAARRERLHRDHRRDGMSARDCEEDCRQGRRLHPEPQGQPGNGARRGAHVLRVGASREVQGRGCHDYFESTDADHGRLEIRRCWITPTIDWFTDVKRWAGLRSFGLVESERTLDGKTTVEQRYFLTTLAGDNAEVFGLAVRQHWTVENSLHWVLDVAFR